MAKWYKINYDSSDLGPWMTTTSGTTWTAGEMEDSGDPIYVDNISVNANSDTVTVNGGYYTDSTGTAGDYNKTWTNFPYKQACDECKELDKEVTKLRTILRELLVDVKEGEAEIDRDKLLDAILAILG